MATKVFEKQPLEVIDYFFNYVDWLASKSDTSASYTLTAATGITLVSHSEVSAGVIQVFISGGTSGQRYKVTCHLTTTGGRVKELDLILKIKDT